MHKITIVLGYQGDQENKQTKEVLDTYSLHNC